jgi:hypothetical protein
MNYEIKKLSPFRLLSIYGYEALGDGHIMYAMIELDITDTRQKLRSERKAGQTVSFFGFLLSAIAKTNKDLSYFFPFYNRVNKSISGHKSSY